MGFDPEMLYESASVVALLERDYTCVVCHLILEDPVRVPNCGHTFCRACIKQWLSTSSICPVDGQEVKKRARLTAPSPRITSMIDNLKIRCRFRSEGCYAIRKLEVIRAHEKTCGYELIDCKRRCGACFHRRHQYSHDCVYAIVKKLDSEVTRELDRSKVRTQNALSVKVAAARKTVKRIQCRVRASLSSLKKLEGTLEKRTRGGKHSDTTSDEDEDEDEEEDEDDSE